VNQPATATAAAAAAAAVSRDGGAVRRDDVDHRAARRHDLPALRIGPSSSPIAAAAASLRSPDAPALVPATAPLVPRAVAVARPAAIEEGVELDEPGDERGELVARGAAIPRPPPPGGAGARLQRTSLPELFVAMVTPDREEAGGLLVEDGAQTLTSGQMRKAEFMRQLRTEVCRVAEQELARAGRSAAGCPYIDQMLAYYEGKSAEHLERAIRRYAPETRRLRDAREYLPVLSARLGAAIARWATTGQMPTDIPNETLAALAGARSGIVGAIAGIAGISRKATPGAAPATVDAGALIRQLGPGHALDGGTQARMERVLGHSFAGVRIHADDRAAALSHDLAARAFTIGPHVAFAAGELRPGTPHGDALLAHELAHVVQQGTAAPSGDVPLGAATDPLEHAADLAAAAAVEQLHGDPRPPVRRPRWRAAGGGLRLQRCPPTPRPVVTGPPQPQVDPMIARYGEALTLLRNLAPDMHALLSQAPLGGAASRIATNTVTEDGRTVQFRHDLRVELVDSLEAGTTEALFRGPPMSEVENGPGYYRFPLQMRVARRPLPTAEHLAATLYHECIHLRLFMDKFTTGSADPTLSPYQASYRGYLRLAHAAPDWNALIAAWAAHLAGGAPVTDAQQRDARERVEMLIEEKYAFNAAEARMGGNQQRSNAEIVEAYLRDETAMPAATKAIIAPLLRNVFDHIDTQRATIPAFPPATSSTSPTAPTRPTGALNPPPATPSP
jgi:Domain of unknown function (DUF4157)